MQKVAVVVLNYNGRKHLERFLPSVVHHSPDASIVVADNCSSDDSVSFLEKSYPSVRIIKLEKNHGFAGGYNEALKQVDATYYLLLNSDVEVTFNWIPPMLDFLEKNERYAACQPKIKSFLKKQYFEYAGAAGGFLDRHGYPYCRGRIFNKLEEDTGQYNSEIDIDWSSGACMLIRSTAFTSIGGFDKDFFAHMEEIDLCWRLRNEGHLLRSIPDSTVYHLGGGTLDANNPFKTYLNFRNGLWLLLKNLPQNLLIKRLFSRILLDWLASGKFLVEGRIRHAFAVFKAHYSFLLTVKKFGRKRALKKIQPSTKSILYQYFIKHRQTYRQIQ
ncbi:MAG: glycosyltransferase family 2 protein [Bacteroidota bacterium]